MTMRSTSPPDTCPEMSTAPVSAPSSTQAHRDSETHDDGSLAQVHDISTSLDVDTTAPLAGTSSLNVPLLDDNKSSGSKRKLEDSDFSPTSEACPTSDNASDAEEKSRAGKKLKQECQQDDEDSSLIPSGHISDAAAILSLDSEQSASPSLDDPLVPSRPDSSDLLLPDVLPSPPTAPVDLPHSLTSPPRSHSAPPTSPIANVTPRVHPFPPPSSLPQDPEPLHTYSCPICFSSPTNATLTPCGHIMCGECLFTAVGAAAARMGIASLAARCPVCRAPIPKWDGRGGGVIGLQPRVVITI